MATNKIDSGFFDKDFEQVINEREIARVAEENKDDERDPESEDYGYSKT